MDKVFITTLDNFYGLTIIIVRLRMPSGNKGGDKIREHKYVSYPHQVPKMH